MSDVPNSATDPAAEKPMRLRDALRQARIEAADRTGVVVDLRDAEVARLELLNEALDPLFKEMPPEIELFDRGVSHGDPPRLWIDVVAHVVMGRDKRHYRFVQDMRYGRKVLAESTEIAGIVEAVTHYVAARLIERERALGDQTGAITHQLQRDLHIVWRRRRWYWLRAFGLGLAVGCIALFATLWVVASRLPQ